MSQAESLNWVSYHVFIIIASGDKVISEGAEVFKAARKARHSTSMQEGKQEEKEKEKKSTPDFERHLSASVGAQPFFYPMISLPFRSGYPSLYRPPVSPRRGSGRPGQRYTGSGFPGCFKCGVLHTIKRFVTKSKFGEILSVDIFLSDV